MMALEALRVEIVRCLAIMRHQFPDIRAFPQENMYEGPEPAEDIDLAIREAVALGHLKTHYDETDGLSRFLGPHLSITDAGYDLVKDDLPPVRPNLKVMP